MSIDNKVKALELAVVANGTATETVARATAYAAFLDGAAAPAGKPATQAAAKPAAATQTSTAAKTAAKPATKPGTTKTSAAAKAPAASKIASVHNEDEVRKSIRAVANHAQLGTAVASNILDEEAGVSTVSQLKPEHYDAVFDAATAKLAEVNGEGEAAPAEGEEADADAGEEFDPTA
jgi:hypothetical protein